MGTSELIKKARQTRNREHRLKPNLRLKSQSEMIRFIHDKGLVSVLGGNELPSIISAVLGKPWKPSVKGFKGWLDWWSLKIEGRRVARLIGEIERRDDIIATRMVGRTKTFVSDELWPILDPIVSHRREQLTKSEILSALDLKLLGAVELKGPVRTDLLRKELRLEGKGDNSRFHRSLNSLESHGLIIGAEDPKPERHLHANIWQTWERRTGGRGLRSHLSYGEAVERLVGRVVESCVLVRQDRIDRLFHLSPTDLETAEEQLLKKKEIVRAGPYMVASSLLGL